MKMIRKAALQVAAPALLAFVVLNAYLAIVYLKRIQKTAALTLESAMIQDEDSGLTLHG
jgi:hypothetical protein